MASSSSQQPRWTEGELMVLIPILLEEKTVGNWTGSGPNSAGLKQTSLALQRRFGISKTPKQIKNKYETLKSEFSCWTKLKNHETGLGWDFTTGAIVATDEWWERKIKEEPLAKKFRTRGPLLEDQQEVLFGNTIATGNNQWTPSSSQFLSDQFRGQHPDDNVQWGGGDQYQNLSPGESAMNAEDPDTPPSINRTSARGGKSKSRLSGEKRKQMEGGSSGEGGSGSRFDEMKQLLSTRNLNINYNYNTHADTEWDRSIELLNELFMDDFDNPLYLGGLMLIEDVNLRKAFVRLPRHVLMGWIKAHVK